MKNWKLINFLFDIFLENEINSFKIFELKNGKRFSTENKVLSNKLKDHFKYDVKLALKTENKVFLITKIDDFYVLNIYDLYNYLNSKIRLTAHPGFVGQSVR